MTLPDPALVVLVGASLSMGGILRIRWTTQLAPCPPREAIIEVIALALQT